MTENFKRDCETAKENLKNGGNACFDVTDAEFPFMSLDRASDRLFVMLSEADAYVASPMMLKKYGKAPLTKISVSELKKEEIASLRFFVEPVTPA